MQTCARRIWGLDASTDGLRFVGIVLLLLALVVMPLDGEEHARAEDENLERNEDYRDPIDHFENFQPRTRH